MKLIPILLLVRVVLLLQSCGEQIPCPPCNCDITPPTKDTLTALDKIGICAFTWTPLAPLDTFRQVRVFVSTNFIYSERGLFVEPIKQSRTEDGKGLDTWLSNCQKRGITPTICVNQSPSFYGHSDPDHPPVFTGKDRTSPESYKEFAQVFGQLARRYGSVKHDTKTLRVDTVSRWTNDPQNKRLSGLNLPLILEVWNEPDKWWKRGTDVYITPQEYGAMLSACYDSIKAADAKILVAMAGLTNFDLDYLNAMDTYFKEKRGGVWPCDIINVHHYSNNANRYGEHPPTWNMSGGVPPELDKDFSRVKDVVKFAKDRKKLLWVTEFGFDTRPPSWMHVVSINGQSDEVTQGNYIVSSYNAYLSAGVDAAFLFTANDEYGAKNGGLYQNSGLLYGEGEQGKEYTPKESYWITLKFMSEISKKPPTL